MKTVEVAQTSIEHCLTEADLGPIVLTRDGSPVAVMTSVAGLDEEQIALGLDDEFWRMIQERRRQKTIPLEELERRLAKLG